MRSPPAATNPARTVEGGGRALLFSLFALSGFAGLIYESIWTHYLKLFLGHAAYAQALVLAIFMGGMAIGSSVAGTRSSRWRNLLAAYAIAEAAIGLLAAVFHEEFVAATSFAYAVALPRLGNAVAVEAFKWSLSAALILPQSILLGMTFPLMSAGLIRAYPDRPGRSLAMLYFTNSLGAAAGVLASGFFLVRDLGLPGTVRAAGALNLFVALAVWLRFRNPRGAAVAGSVPVPRAVDRGFRAFLLVAFVTGASSFVYEVSWIRMLGLVLGASTHAFELMLCAFILGLALGGLFIQRRIDRLASPVRALAWLQVAMGLFAIATLPLYAWSFDGMRWLVTNLPRTDSGYVLFNLSSSAIAMAVMLPATFCAGTTLPLITFHLVREGYGESSIGAVYSANTVGAIVAVFLATHFGMPLLGLKGLLASGAAIDVALGLWLAWSAGAAFRTRRIPAGLSAAGVLGIAAVVAFVPLDPRRLASGVYRTGRLLDPEREKVVFHRDGKTATVDVIENGARQVRISTGGKIDAAVNMAAGQIPNLDEYTMTLAGVVPIALHPGARTAACIGFGSGMTTHTLLADPRLEVVDTVEIEEQMVEGARRFHPRNRRAYEDPRSHLHIDDAKTFFSSSPRKYDLVVSEPSNPWVSGVAGLFSDEFYKTMLPHLNEGALFVQWIQLYEIDVPLIVSVLKAIEANFSDYVVYAPNDVDALVVARNGGSIGSLDEGVLSLPEVQEALREIRLNSASDLEIRRVGTRSSWRGITGSYAIAANSDYRPILDQNAARVRFLGVDAFALLQFQRRPLPALELLDATAGTARVRTDVSVSPISEASVHAFQATQLRDVLLGRATAGTFAAMGPAQSVHARVVAEWLELCARGAPLPRESLLRISQDILSELTPAEHEQIWRGVSSRCDRALTATDRSWIAFLAAVGRRDARGMAGTARALLAGGHATHPRITRFLVAAGMLGSLASGDAADSAALWERYSPSLDVGDDLLLKLLVARSQP